MDHVARCLPKEDGSIYWLLNIHTFNPLLLLLSYMILKISYRRFLKIYEKVMAEINLWALVCCPSLSCLKITTMFVLKRSSTGRKADCWPYKTLGYNNENLSSAEPIVLLTVTCQEVYSSC